MENNKIIKTIKSSINRHQTLIKLGWNNTTSGYHKLNEFIKENNVDVTHYETKKNQYKRLGEMLNNSTTIPLEQILISESTYVNGSNIKRKLYREGLKTPICEKCGQDEYWNGEKISLILDHINGIHNDNRIENLRILCPNCNATLSTHCGRNIKRPQKIIVRVSEDQKRNNKIKQSFNERKIERPPYDQLMNEINDLGYVKVGKKYGVSDNAIRKWVNFYEKYS